eukprot:1143441-Pelagomonas_calceolata.AAC.1
MLRPLVTKFYMMDSLHPEKNVKGTVWHPTKGTLQENISRTIPDWVFPSGTGSSARHQSGPDAAFVRSIPG